jgi:hypothetical protein
MVPALAAAETMPEPPRRFPAINVIQWTTCPRARSDAAVAGCPGGAFIGGLLYGEGMLDTKNAGDLKVFWQGPTVGYDFGGDGARTMMLVYNLPSTPAIYQRFAGLSGSAYFIGGSG